MTDVAHKLGDLFPYLEVREVVLLEVSGKRRDAFDTSDVPPSDDPMQMQIYQEGNEREIRLRFRLALNTSDGLYVVDALGLFTVSKPMTFAPKALEEFIQTVGIPVVYPYVRSEIQSMARRLGLKSPVLGLFKPEEHKLELARSHGLHTEPSGPESTGLSGSEVTESAGELVGREAGGSDQPGTLNQ